MKATGPHNEEQATIRVRRRLSEGSLEHDAVAIIPARGGSVRIPRKNLAMFHGAPLITYSIAAAKACGLFDRIIVTTDDDEIRRLAEQWGVEAAKRPPHMVEPDPGTQAVAADLLRTLAEAGYKPAHACVIYATAPLMRRADLIRGYVEVSKGRHFAFSVGLEPLVDAGQFYWGWTDSFLQQVPLYDVGTALIPVPAGHVCDINVPEDLARAEQMYTAAREEAGWTK